jgi:hypothetical protein
MFPRVVEGGPESFDPRFQTRMMATVAATTPTAPQNHHWR